MQNLALVGLASHNRRCYHSLAVAKASVAGADLNLLEDFESSFLEPCAQQARQSSIMHATAGESDLENSRGVFGQNCCAYEGCSNASVKARGNARFGDARAKIGEEIAP